MKILYSPDASEKLKNLKNQISETYGKEISKKIISGILLEIKNLENFPKIGASIKALLNIPTDYRFLHTHKNYIFYRIDKELIYIVDIYDEREDFLKKLFISKI